MILTGAKLKQICREVWGMGFPPIIAQYFGCSRQTVHNLCNRETGHPRRTKLKLLHAMEDHVAMVSQHINEIREDLGV